MKECEFRNFDSCISKIPEEDLQVIKCQQKSIHES